MPANKKYLIKSSWAKGSKVIAAILGSFVASMSLHLALTYWLPRPTVLITSTFSVFVIWILLMLWVYAAETAIKSWLILGSILVLSAILVILGKSMV
jgi:hypothetical protein